MRRLLSTIIALAASSTATAGQSHVVPEAVSCARCSIDVRALVSMGTVEGPGSLPGRPWDLLVDGKGRYWVALTDHFPMIFDANGKFIQQFGKKGSGPGEFRFIGLKAALPGDSMLVNDLNRLVVVAPDLSIARTIRTNLDVGQIKSLDWPLNNVVFAYSRGGAERASTLQQLDLSGPEAQLTRVLLSQPFGRTAAEYASSFRKIGTTKPQYFWAAHVNRYRLVRYDAVGAARDSLERKPAWFPGGAGLGMGNLTRPAAPQFTDMWEDAQGRLWTLSAQPRTDGSQAWRGIKVQGNEMAVANMPPAFKMWRTMVEVIDPVKKRVIARKLLDTYAFAAVSGNRIATFTEDELGIPRITIHQLTLREN
jgi:hypothetical protein